MEPKFFKISTGSGFAIDDVAKWHKYIDVEGDGKPRIDIYLKSGPRLSIWHPEDIEAFERIMAQYTKD